MTAVDVARLEADMAAYDDAFNNRALSRQDWLVAVGEAAVGVVEHVPSLFADHRAVERVRALCEDVERGWANPTRVDLSHTGSPAVMVDRVRAALGGAE